MARGDREAWKHKREIVMTAAADSGRDPAAIAASTTLERPLPETDAEAQALLEELGAWCEAGVDYFVMDFGHPETPDHIARFVEQVMTPLKSSAS